MTLYLPFYREGKDRGKLLENVIKYVKFPTVSFTRIFLCKTENEIFLYEFLYFQKEAQQGKQFMLYIFVISFT